MPVLRVLLLEDNEQDAELLAHTLRQGGLEFEWRRVETERDYLLQLQWNPDVILADYNLPQADLPTALRFLKEHSRSIPLIVVSGAIGEETAADMMKQGATDYLLKDRLTRLPSAVRNALRETQLAQEKQALEARDRRNDARLRAFMENAPFGFCRLEAKTGGFVAANSALVQMLGYGSERELLSLSLAHDVQTDKSILVRLKNNATFAAIETIWKRKDGKLLTVLLSGRLLQDDHNEQIETIVDDITERRLLESQLHESQKIEAVGRLAGGVAHDFNNLLQVIVAGCGLLSAQLGLDGSPHEEVEEILKACQHAKQLVSQLLAFGRKQVVQVQSLDLNAIVSQASEMLRRIVREDIKFTTVLAGDIGHIKADRTQITQILLNLAANARDAMPRGGILKIATRKAMLPPNVQTGAIQPPEQRYVLLEVTDTGTGMDEETKARVFEPFFTTKKAVGVGLGTGLGLATVYGIVQQNHGHVCLDSHVGKGTTFSVYLPLADEVIEPERAVPAPAPAEVARATVLLVEDSEQIRKLLCKALESEQYNLLSAADGVEALNVAERHKGPIHLLITDVMLPGIHGPELANQLRTSWPGLRVVYMSGYSDDVLIGAQVKGAFVTKPIELAILRKIVSDTLALTPQSTSEAHAGPTRRAG